MPSLKILFLLTISTFFTTSLAGLWCSADDSTAAVTDWAAAESWKVSMLVCLESLHYTGWQGRRCFPTYNLDPAMDRDPNPHPTFSFWKTGARQFRDAKDCWEQCQSCLRRGIQAGRAVKTQCNYQASGLSLGRTCEMGFNYDDMENLAASQPGGLNNQEWVSLGQWEPFLGWKGTINPRNPAYPVGY
ncbi:MAG: hypothetical protein Q9169_003026 [Polycauliona sp. 2 TL-2023]